MSPPRQKSRSWRCAWSGDEGRTWSAVGLHLTGRECVLPTAGITARAAQLQLVVSDGFYTVMSNAVPLELPEREPQVAIVFSPDRARLRGGGSMRLWGVGISDVGEHLPEESLRWSLDGEEIGVGTEVWPERDITEGEHVLILVAESGDHRVETLSRFTVSPPPRSNPDT